MVMATVLGLSALWQVPARGHTPLGRGAHLQQQQSVQWHSSGPRRRAQS